MLNRFACGDAAATGSGPHFENLSISGLGGTEDCDSNCFQITVAQYVDKVPCKFRGCQR